MTDNAEIVRLADLVRSAKHAYYNTDCPIMSDDEYDEFEEKLKAIDPNNPALGVGAAVVSEWKKAMHDIPMSSLSKCKTTAAITQWVNDRAFAFLKKGMFHSDKLDGLSVEIKYKVGNLVQAITRGDGETGEDITVNVMKMHGVVATLPLPITGSLRGEIILLRENHKKHFPIYKNPRNAASGISKRYDGLGCEFIDVFFYDAIIDGREFMSEGDKFDFIKNDLSLQTPTYGVVTGAASGEIIASLIAVWQTYQSSTRDTLPYDIDGIVVRVNDIPSQVALGTTNLVPKGAIAFKFPSDEATTTIRSIEKSVGNTGTITPVAIYDPVHLMGVTNTRASLYNWGYIKELGIDVGAVVTVLRAGDVIPRVEALEKGTGTVAQPPMTCPECGAKTAMRGDFCVCTNMMSCPAQVSGRIKNWVNRLNLLDVGVGLIDKLVEKKMVKSVADLYRLTERDLVTIDRMGWSSAKKVVDIIEQKKNVTIEKLLGSLTIQMIGESTITALTDAGHTTLEGIFAMSESKLSMVPKIGWVKAQKLYEGLRANKALIDELLSLGVTIKSRTGCLAGKSFQFTGTMKNKRALLKELVENNGGTIKSGSSLSYLVVADPNSNSSKNVAARKNGTKCISEDEFLAMLK